MPEVERWAPPPGLARFSAQRSAEIAQFEPWDDWVNVFAQVVQLAEYVQHTDFVPADFKGKPDVIAAVFMTGREMHLGPMMALRSLYPVKGRVGQTAEMMRAKALEAGHEILVDELTAVKCVVRGRRKNQTEWTQVTFTADQAKRMGLNLTGQTATQGGKYRPEDKLYARATSRLCRMVFADAIAGIPSVDELEDADASPTDGNGRAVTSGGAGSRRMQRKLSTGTPPASATSGTETAAEEPPGPDAPTSPDDAAAAESAPDAPETSTTNGDSVQVSNSTFEDAPRPVREQQLRALGALFTNTLRITDVRDDRQYQDRHLLTSAIIGRMVDSWNSLTAEEAGKVISTTGNCPKGDEERAAWIQRGLDKGREMMAAQVIAPEDEETLAEHIAETASEESPEEPSVDADDIEDADVVERGEGGTEASDSE